MTFSKGNDRTTCNGCRKHDREIRKHDRINIAENMFTLPIYGRLALADVKIICEIIQEIQKKGEIIL